MTVSLKFGGTEIEALARSNCRRGEDVSCRLEFREDSLTLSRKSSRKLHREMAHRFVCVDVCFVMDCTGSIFNMIDAAKTQVSVCICICMCMCICVCVYIVYVCMCVCVCVYVCMYV